MIRKNQKFKKLKKGEMAMGTLIIFIAMILIAAVAAAVLITTISSLQTKALETGRATRQEIGTNLQVIEIFGMDGSSGSTIEDIVVLMKLSAGSENVRFDDLLITLGLSDTSEYFRFNKSANCTDESGQPAVDGKDYAVQYSIQGPNNVEGYLTKGDVATLCFKAQRPIGETEYFRLSMIPKVGTPTIINTVSPDTMSRVREYIFP